MAPLNHVETNYGYHAPTFNSSRRASMAFSALAQSLPKPIELTKPKTRPVPQPEIRPQTRSLRQRIPSRMPNLVSNNPPSTSEGKKGSELNQEPPGRIQSPPSANTRPLSARPPKTLGVMSNCVVFVDVRTEEGEDAGALFVDMLRSLGAKVRFGT